MNFKKGDLVKFLGRRLFVARLNIEINKGDLCIFLNESKFNNELGAIVSCMIFHIKSQRNLTLFCTEIGDLDEE